MAKGGESMNRQKLDDDYADTQVLGDDQGVAPAVTSAGAWRDRPEPPELNADAIEALYQEYVKACDEARLKAKPPR